MATLWITEYARLPIDGGGQPVAVGIEPSIDTQTVAIGVTSAQSQMLNSNTRFRHLHCDTNSV